MAWASTLLAFPFLVWQPLGTLAQSISTTTPLPPLQWINLSKIGLTGPGPPPLKDASIGYDNIGQTLLVFGGESASGFPQASTYLFNLTSLTWRKPSPTVGGTRSPSARSAAVGGSDFAANSRHGHIVIGGKGAAGEVLSDVWEFDYLNEFWDQVTLSSSSAPSPRFGASGGIDTRIDPASDPSNGLKSSFYLAGGRDANKAFPLSDFWRLDVSGVLAANVQGQVSGSWERIAIEDLPVAVEQAGTVVNQRTVAFGGCNATSFTGNSCAQTQTYVLDATTGQRIAPPACPAPRLGAILVPNMNTFSGGFQQQAFILLGTTNTSLWDDDKGLEKGEVSVLDVTQGTWTRVLPAGDPASGASAFPSAREGAAVVSLPGALVGSQEAVSDTIVFGGRDNSGNYLSDLWLLRSYNGVVTGSGQKWSGYGDGKLTGGVNANGAGVTLDYLTRCAVPIKTANPPTQTSKSSSRASTPTSTSSNGTPTAFPTSDPSASSVAHPFPYDTSAVHKILSPVSIGLVALAVIGFRLSSPTASRPVSGLQAYSIHLSSVLGFAAYAAGLAGVIFSFLTIRTTSTLSRRSIPSNATLKTNHGKAGLALFLVLFGLIPILYAIPFISTRLQHARDAARTEKTAADIEDARADEPDTSEKHGYFEHPGSTGRSVNTMAGPSARPDSPPARTRVHSLHANQSHLYPPSPAPAPNPERTSSETESEAHLGAGAHDAGATAPPVRSFEVTNRLKRGARQQSMSGLDAFAEQMGYSRQSLPRMPVPRTLSDVSWLERRRSLNAVDELDYALTRIQRAPAPPTPATTDALILDVQTHSKDSERDSLSPSMPSLLDAILHILLHSSILALLVLTLVALWNCAPIAAFAIFLAWAIVFYAILLILAWHGRPRNSILTTIIHRLRVHPPSQLVARQTAACSAPPTPRPLSLAGMEPMVTASDARGPYIHQPPHRSVLSSPSNEDDYITATSHGGHRSVEGDSDGDENDDERQRRIEDEMNRRDVFSIVTTAPKRRLWIANPS